MSLDKAIESGKERRKQYRRGKAVNKSCRNHGSCPACKGTRNHKNKRRLPIQEAGEALGLSVLITRMELNDSGIDKQ